MAYQWSDVLYVEDEEGDRFLMKRAFAKCGIEKQLHTVEDGQAAIDYLSGAGAFADGRGIRCPGWCCWI